jgi:fatty acid omega-hydroxylase
VPFEREIFHSVDLVNEYTYKVIRQRRSDPNLAERTDLLSRYLAMKDVDGKPFTDEYVRDILVNFMLAGR